MQVTYLYISKKIKIHRVRQPTTAVTWDQRYLKCFVPNGLPYIKEANY